MKEIAVAVLLFSAATFVLGVALFIFLKKGSRDEKRSEVLLQSLRSDQGELRQEISKSIQNSVSSLGQMLSKTQGDRLDAMEKRLGIFSMENEQKLENIRVSVEKRLEYLQSENNKKLDEMRSTVDEKLQKTLENKMAESFKLVSERLEQVHKGLGEMQTLANGVGDLKKVLSNVKTRGTLGEIQLGAILREILTPDQYDENVTTKKGSSCRVEFAVKLPADNGKFIYLPIDSKFPGDRYATLRDAYESGSDEEIRLAAKELITTVKSEAKDIRDKYLDVPNTTNFAIMFLPFEGLYSEVVNRGMVEVLQREYNVNIAGPSTMAALLNSLQMGFKTLAVQKRSEEVWRILNEIKTEFGNFNDALTLTQKRLRQADEELDKLVGTRSRAMERRLRDIHTNEVLKLNN